MSYLNVRDQVLETKIVYYGAGLSGKTTNLVMIRHRLNDGRCGEMMSLNTDGDRTLFFDWLPLSLGQLNGCDIKVQLYTVPGQAKYVETRKRVLRDADGVVLVLDSASGALDKNREIVAEMRQHVQEFGLEAVPVVVQLNKRDLPSAMERQALLDELGLDDPPCVEAVASEGRGVLETLKLVTRWVVRHVKTQILRDSDAVARGEDRRLDGQTLFEQLEEACGGVPMGATSPGARTQERSVDMEVAVGDAAVNGGSDAPPAPPAWRGAVMPLPTTYTDHRSGGVVSLPVTPPPRDLVDVVPSVPSEIDTGAPLRWDDATSVEQLCDGYQSLCARLSRLELVTVESTRQSLRALDSLSSYDSHSDLCARLEAIERRLEGPVEQERQERLEASVEISVELLTSLSRRLEQLIANTTCMEADQEVLRVRLEEIGGKVEDIRETLELTQHSVDQQPQVVQELVVESMEAKQMAFEELVLNHGLDHRQHLAQLQSEQRRCSEQAGAELRSITQEMRRLFELLVTDGGKPPGASSRFGKRRWWRG